MEFRALVVDKREARGTPAASIQSLPESYLDETSAEDAVVSIDVLYSSLNYKDALAIAGRPGVIRDYPLVPGIDLVGEVTDAPAGGRFTPGDTVVLNGDGIGERRDGGLAQRARVREDALISLPASLSPARAAAIGTAGFTAMLATLALARQGVSPDDGDLLVTGAAGGVGSIAVTLLAGRGYRVVASTGRAETEGDYLRGLGAVEVIDRAGLQEAGKPLQSQRWAGAVDSVGSHTLANVLAQTNYGGTVVACGLAQGTELPSTVMPFILRGVTLAGANSVDAPLPLRQQAWDALAAEIDGDLLDSLSETIALDEAIVQASRLLEGRVRGRTVVDVRR